MFQQRKNTHSPRTCRPRIEALEVRSCLSVTVGLDNVSGILTITGTDAPEIVKVIHDDNAGQVRVQHDGVTDSFLAADIDKMVVNLAGGNDSYTETLQQGSNFFRTFPTEINTGAGKDTILLDLAGNANFWATLKEDIDIDVIAGTGADAVQLNIPYVEIGNHLDIDVWLGGGKDRLDAIAYGGVGLQGSMQLSAYGEGGADVLSYYGTYDPMNPSVGIKIADQAIMDVYFDGGAGKDRLNADYSGEVDGLCSFYLHGDQNNLGGPQRDRVSVHTYAKTGSTGDLYGNVLGGEGNDVLKLLAEGDVPAGAQLNAVGDEGFDSCVNTYNVNVQTCEA